MRLSETFNSIQGEGPLQGRPAFFIRLAGCNLKCSFCDTPYAQKAGDEAGDVTVVRDQMLAMTEKHGRDYPFVITGGEPLLQTEAVESLLGTFFARSAKRANVWFETNGTIKPSRTLVMRYQPKFVVSPKIGKENREALKALSELGAHFKFVIDSKKSWSFDLAMNLMAELEVPKERIWMQPMAATTKDILKAGATLWLQCEENGVGFSPRLQTVFFGKTRGV